MRDAATDLSMFVVLFALLSRVCMLSSPGVGAVSLSDFW